MTRRVLPAGLAAIALGASDAPAGAPNVSAFGTTRTKEPVERIAFANERGMRVAAITYGATLTAIEVPDRCGHVANVVLNLPDVATLERTQRRWAGVVGRYAGRIGDARFTLGGQTYQLEPGRNGVTLHGGSKGYDSRLWRARPFTDRTSLGVVFSLDSPDGDQGFPGRLHVEVTYRLLKTSNELRIEYRARSDADTVINLTNHGFYNLAGAGHKGLGTHSLWIDAPRYAEVDSRKIPTGRLLPVKDTALDFTKAALLDEQRLSIDPLLTSSQGVDHSLVFADRRGSLPLRAVVEEKTSGRRLEIRTTARGAQLNTGNGFDGSETGGEGIAYQRHDGFAFETQYLPDSPNRPEFPSTVLKRGTDFFSLTALRFSTSRTSPARCTR